MKKNVYGVFAAFGLLLLPATALAHHPLAGAPMETFAHGLLSGIGHPLLGFDHLFFVLAVGIAAVFTSRRFALPGAYIFAMLIGCIAMSSGLGLPMKELAIATSLVVVGVAVFRGKALGVVPAMALFAGFGLFHGSAFGDSIATQEATMGAEVLVGYLIGLGIVQYGLAVGAGLIMQRMIKATSASDIRARIPGAMVAGAGAFLVLENLEGVVLSMLGLAA